MMKSPESLVQLSDFAVVIPRRIIPQNAALDWFSAFHARHNHGQLAEIQAKVKKYSCASPSIRERGADVPDILQYDWDKLAVYNSDISTRGHFYQERATEVFRKFYPERSVAPDHIVHVTCTGYASPSPPQRLIAEKGWHKITSATHAYHMGCYASLPAVRIAEGLVAAQRGRVDIVHTEICSLHLHPVDSSPEQIVAQSLFSDGHVKYTVRPVDRHRPGYVVRHVLEEIVPDTAEMITWKLGSSSFTMGLSPKVPEVLAQRIRPFFDRLIAPVNISLEHALKEAKFAIHPGGPKVIEFMQRALELRDDQVASSKAVLASRGNMSSASLPHIWENISSAGVAPGTPVISFAFGPGLTLFGALFEAT